MSTAAVKDIFIYLSSFITRHAGVIFYFRPRRAYSDITVFMSNEAPAATPEDKAKYDAAKKELLQALAKKRMVDKQLVSSGLGCVRMLLTCFALQGPVRSANFQPGRQLPNRDRNAERWQHHPRV